MRIILLAICLLPLFSKAQNNFIKTTTSVVPGFVKVLDNKSFFISNPALKIIEPYFNNKPLAGLWDEKRGKLVLAMRYNQDMKAAGAQGQVIVWDSSGYYGIFDAIKEKWIISPELRIMNIAPYHEKLAKVSHSGGWQDLRIESKREGYVDSTGKFVIPMDYLLLGESSEGLISFYKPDGKGYGFIDDQNKVVIPAGLKISSQFKEGLAKAVHGTNAEGDDLYGYIDRSGKFVIKTNFTYVEDFYKGYARVDAVKLKGNMKYNQRKMGVINRKGDIVIPAEYEYVSLFNHTAKTWQVIAPQGKFGILDSSGKTILPPIYKDIQYEVNGFCIAKNEVDETGIIDMKGKWAIAPKKGQQIRRKFGSRIEIIDNGKFSLYTNSLKPIISNIEATETKQFNGTIAIVGPSGLQVYDTSGRKLGQMMVPNLSMFKLRVENDSLSYSIFPGQFIFNSKNRTLAQLGGGDITSDISDGFVLIKSPDGRSSRFYNLLGKETGIAFKDATGFSEGIASVIAGNQHYLIDTNFRSINLNDGIPIAEKRYISLYFGPMSEGLGLWSNQDKKLIGYADRNGNSSFFINAEFGSKMVNGRIRLAGFDKQQFFVDRNGKKISDKTYPILFDFSNGMAPFSRDGKYGYLDTTGKEVIPAIYQKASSFQKNNAMVMQNDVNFLIDRNGKKINTQVFQTSSDGMEGAFVVSVKQNPKFGLIDEFGKTLIPNEYDEIPGMMNGVVVGRKGNEWYLMNKTGQIYGKREAKSVVPLNKDFYAYQVKDITGKDMLSFGIADMKGNTILEPIFDQLGKPYGDHILVLMKSYRNFKIPLQ